MNILQLNFNKFNIGELIHNGSEYVFTINKESEKLMLKTGGKIALFNEAGGNVTKSTELPLVFKRFLPDTLEKEQLLEQLGVNKTDSEFEKLIKISKLNLDKNAFWLQVK